MTLIEVIDAARKVLKDKLDPARSFPDNTSSFLEDGEMTTWYNYSQLETQGLLGQTFESWFTTSTSVDIVAEQEEYAMPADILRVIRVEDITNSSAPMEILPIGLNDKDKMTRGMYYDKSGISDFGYYAIKGNNFIIRPRPIVTRASAIKVYYSKMAPASTSATTCSILPNQYHELLMWGVVENGLIKQESTAEAMAVVLGRRNRLVKNMMDSGEQRQVQRPRQVKRHKRR